ncbi:MAG: adenylosuccinate synthetase [Chloroflexota bacterium]
MTTKNAIIISDLQYGDAGKGSIVDYLTREHDAHTVIRFNGGAQAAHNVVTPDGRHHTFAQFGAGMFVPGVQTYLSRYMLIDPPAMLAEGDGLAANGVANPFTRTIIDRDALIISPFQQYANRLRELARGDGRHGSCGMGIGETMADWLAHGEDVLFTRDLADAVSARRKLRFLREMKADALTHEFASLAGNANAREMIAAFTDDDLIDACIEVYAYLAERATVVDAGFLADLLARDGTVIFEAAQGVLLDEWYGFHPYTTWSTTTFENANALLAEHNYTGAVTRYGLIRAYMTRHGAGPFVSESADLTRLIPDYHNGTNPWQQAFRVGYFDALAIRYAMEAAGEMDALVVTNLDRMVGVPQWQVCTGYTYGGDAGDLDTYFVREDDRITGIRVNHNRDLDYQAELTRRLWDCDPIYETFACHGNTEAYVAWLEALLDNPVAITSSGVTADDKQRRVPQSVTP